MECKQVALEAKKQIVRIRRVKRVIVSRQAVPEAAAVETSSVLRTVKILRKPVEAIRRTVVVRKKPAAEIVATPAEPKPTVALATVPAAPAATASKKQPDRWSDCGQIYFTGGRAYGISPGLRTILVGEQPSVESFLLTGALDDGLTETQKEALRRIKEGKTLQLAASRS